MTSSSKKDDDKPDSPGTHQRRPFALATLQLSVDTIAAFEQLRDEAAAGEIIGAAYAVMFKRRKYSVGVTGECARSPTFTLGMVRVLEDKLIRRALAQR